MATIASRCLAVVLAVAATAAAVRADEPNRGATADNPLVGTWKAVSAKYGGMEVSDARRLKAPEDENVKLNKLLAEAILDNAILRDVAARKW